MKKLFVFLVFLTIKSYVENHLHLVLDGNNCENCDLSGTDLKNRDFQGFFFNGTSFRNADISNSKFIGAQLNNTDFSGANATNADFSSTLLNHAKAHNADFSNVKFINSIAKFSEWNGARLNKSNFFLADLSNSNFKDSDITDIVLQGSNLYFVNLDTEKGIESLTGDKQTENMPLGIMYWPLKYCCTRLPYGQLKHFNNPATCTEKDKEECLKIAHKNNLNISVIEPF